MGFAQQHISGDGPIPLLDVSANTTGEWIPVTAIHRLFQINITGTATVTLEITIDKVNSKAINGATFTATDFFSTSQGFPFVRAVSSGMAAATAEVLMVV